MAAEYREVSFHGLVGSTHNYGGLAIGNIASEGNKGIVSRPRDAFLQGLEHAFLGVRLGLCEAVLPPHPRPYIPALWERGYTGSDWQIIENVARDDLPFLARMSSSSFMWTANAATIAPSCDTGDGRLHITPASMTSNLHRAIEAAQTTATLRRIFDSIAIVHDPIETGIDVGDEGAANHMRFARDWSSEGVHLFVYGRNKLSSAPHWPKKYPARQSFESSYRVATQHSVPMQTTIFAQQHPNAIDAGAFHNDVISTNNGLVWLVHEKAYVNTKVVLRAVRDCVEGNLLIFEAQESCLSLDDAVASYVFNSRIATLPDGTMAILAPIETRELDVARMYLESTLSSPASPIKSIHYVDLSQSMRNGGGPACLRLRVVMSEEERSALRSRVLLDEPLYQELQRWGMKHYREELHPKDLADPRLLKENHEGLDELTQIMGLGSIYYFQKDATATDVKGLDEKPRW